MDPTTKTSVPTQTLAKFGEDTPGSTNVVLDVTFTVTVAPFLNEVSVKLPVPPAAPQVPDALSPPTAVTLPAALGRG